MCEICSKDCTYWKKGSIWKMLKNWDELTQGPVELRRYATSKYIESRWFLFFLLWIFALILWTELG